MLIEITDRDQKSAIAETVLKALPEWFGIEDATRAYIEAVQKQYMVAYEGAEGFVGFASLEETGALACDMHVLGVLPAYHGTGVGKKLVRALEYRARTLKKRYVTVKTLSEAHPDVHYAKTRSFYQHLGYAPLETLPELWGRDNPCLYMIKALEVPTVIEVDETVRLRRYHASDAKAALKWYRTPAVLKGSEGVEGRVYTLEKVEEMYRYLDGIGYLYMIEFYDVDHWRTIGDATLSPNTLPICIGETAYWGQGVGTRVLKALLALSKDLGYPSIHLNGIYAYNTASLKLYKRCGFEETGVRGEKVTMRYVHQ